MSFRNMWGLVASEHDLHVVACARQLAHQMDVNAMFAAIGWRPEAPVYSEAWPIGDRWDAEFERSRNEINALQTSIAARLGDVPAAASIETHMLDTQDARRSVGQRARLFDLTLVGRPAEKVLGDAHTLLIEGVLFESGRPVLVVPPQWRAAPVGQRIVVCWNGSREAARALADAGPFLDAAVSVTVMTATTQTEPDANLAQVCDLLRRHCANTSLRRLDPATSTDALALLEAAAHQNADLIVMGGYGRARLSEIIFGGVTREMLAGAQLPVLMSH